MWPNDRAELRKLTNILSNGAQFTIRDRVVANPDLVGQTITVNVPVSDNYDQLNKGMIDPDTPEANRRLKDDEIAHFNQLKRPGGHQAVELGAVDQRGFAVSRACRPEGCDHRVCLCASGVLSSVVPGGHRRRDLPRGIRAENRISDLIEININNLAAVPSVVFGLLGLAVFIGWFGMPRSVPFVGG